MNFSWSKVQLLTIVLFLSLFPLAETIFAQDDQPDGPVYIIQEGDTLWGIAQRFGVPWEDLARANDITDPGQLSAGDELVIPGIDGAGEILITMEVPLGESLRSLSRRYNLPQETMILLNHLTSPAELYKGYNHNGHTYLAGYL